ncbi:MAG: Gfo/Idh/MocA family oxidoreductase [Armatimonadetes bacterium]|nr:Gfo/Idh/MocA family oxidoreductase [Armatimonadota bacterium]MDW8028529.1 Gfo/Idh/MocA family oxidoreductase [Armatimonadota bacterium]
MAVRVAVVGLGFMGVTHYRSYKKVKGAKVVAVFSRDPKKLAGDWRNVRGNLPTETGGHEDLSGVKRYDDLDAILNDPDADLVDICLPTHLHTEATIKALQAGKHVLVEKPIALNLKDADKMIETAQKVGRFLMVGQVLRFFPEFRLLKEMQEKGEYGRLKGLYLRRIISKPTWSAENWFADPKKSGGPIIDLHIHDADFVIFMFGLPERVFTTGWIDYQRDTPEYFVTQYQFADKEVAVTAVGGDAAMDSWVFEHGYDAFFERATVEFNSRWGKPPILFTEDGKQKEVKFKTVDPFIAELQYAVDCVRKKEHPALLGAESARNALLLCLKEAESLRKGKPVKVEA